MLFAEDTDPKHFTRPYTFLAFGGFFFTIIMGAFPHGFDELFDIIWFDLEVSQNLYDRWGEAFSLTSLLFGRFSSAHHGHIM